MTFLEAIIGCYVRPQRQDDKIKWYQNHCRFYIDEFYKREIHLKWTRRMK